MIPNTRIPIMSSVVMTGRLMKRAVSLMSRSRRLRAALSSTTAATAAAAAGPTSRIARTAQVHRGALRQARLAVRHDPFSLANSRGDHGEPIRAPLDGHGPLLRNVRGINHEDIGAALARDHALRRNHERAVLDKE